jgi:Ca2+-dependent lipid-binding protein
LGKSSGKTKTLKETIFPIWYESVTFNVELPEGYNPEVHVSVWDWDRFDSDDFLGRFSVPTGSVTDKLPDEPTWYPLCAKDSSNPEGEILASFQL